MRQRCGSSVAWAVASSYSEGQARGFPPAHKPARAGGTERPRRPRQGSTGMGRCRLAVSCPHPPCGSAAHTSHRPGPGHGPRGVCGELLVSMGVHFSDWLLNSPSEGVASRMLLSTMFMGMTSNCLEACFMPSCSGAARRAPELVDAHDVQRQALVEDAGFPAMGVGCSSVLR